MTTTLNAVTYGGGVTLTLLDEDAASVRVPPLTPADPHSDAPDLPVAEVGGVAAFTRLLGIGWPWGNI